MMPEQLVFDLPVDTAFGRDDYFVSGANAVAVEAICAWHTWPGGKLLLLGPEGSGKSHLGAIWAEQADAQVLSGATLSPDPPQSALFVDDAHLADPAHLFHIFNAATAGEWPLMMTGPAPLAAWGVGLPDLISRLSATQTLTLGAPDDALLAALLIKQFEDRQLRIDAGLIDYLLPRMDRSFSAAKNLIQRLDTAALRLKRPVTPRLARTVLKELDM